jgi:hypothetical protein
LVRDILRYAANWQLARSLEYGSLDSRYTKRRVQSLVPVIAISTLKGTTTLLYFNSEVP